MPARVTKDAKLLALAIAQIHIGVAMARAKGVVCGSPRDIKLTTLPKARKQ